MKKIDRDGLDDEVFEYTPEEVEMIESEALNIEYARTVSIEYPIHKTPSVPTAKFSNLTVPGPTLTNEHIKAGYCYGVNPEIGTRKTMNYLRMMVSRVLNHEFKKRSKKYLSTAEQESLENGGVV